MSTFTNVSKNASTATNTSKTQSSYGGISILLESGYKVLLESASKLLLENANTSYNVSWSNTTKNTETFNNVAKS